MYNSHINRCYVCKDEVRRGQRYQIVGQHFGHTKCIENRVGLLSILGIFLILTTFSCAKSFAQEKTFSLGKPIAEEGIMVCLEKEAAINIANTLAEGGQAGMLAQLYINFGICNKIAATVVYSTKVHHVILPNKTRLNVYAGKVGELPIFVLMDWEHIEVRI